MVYQLHPSAPAFAVQPDMAGLQDRAVATPLADGGLLVVYQNRVQPDPEGDWNHSVRAQRLDSAGNRIGEPQTLAEFSHWYSGIWAPPGAVGLADGGYAIAWSDFETQHLRIQTYDANGAQTSDALSILPPREVINANTGFPVQVTLNASQDIAPALTALDHGGFAVAWQAGHGGMMTMYGAASSSFSQPFSATGQPMAQASRIMDWSTGHVSDTVPLTDGQYLAILAANP